MTRLGLVTAPAPSVAMPLPPLHWRYRAASLNPLRNLRKKCLHFQVCSLPRPQEGELEARRYAALEGNDVEEEESVQPPPKSRFEDDKSDEYREEEEPVQPPPKSRFEDDKSDEYRDLDDDDEFSDDHDDYEESTAEQDDDDELEDESEDSEDEDDDDEDYDSEESDESFDESDEEYNSDEDYEDDDDDEEYGVINDYVEDGEDDDEEGLIQRDENDVRARIDRPFDLPLVTGTSGPYPGPRRVDLRRRRGGFGRPAHGLLLLKPPMSDKKLASRILASPQLRLKTLPVLSSLLPTAAFRELDKEWIVEHSVEVKDILGYAELCKEFEEKDVEDEEQFWQHGNPDPKAHLDTLLYLAFQHEESRRSKQLKHTRFGHSRLAFLGQYVLNLAMAELLLQVYPKDMPSSLRERAFNLTNKRGLLKMFYKAGLYHLVFPDYEPEQKAFSKRCGVCKSVFLAMIAAVYVTLGMGEVYRLLFETFGLDLDEKAMQPRPRSRHVDVDKVSADFEGRRLTWKDVAFYKPPEDALFAAPRLFRACVPPGMYRFRRNLWDMESLPQVMRILRYPLYVGDESPAMTEMRNLELGLGLQLCFLHASMYRGDHPRFCNERLQLLGAGIQDVVMAERLLMRHLDAPSNYLLKRHKRLLVNRICGRRLRMKRLHFFYQYGQARAMDFERFRRLRTFTHADAQQAIHAIGYLVYGKSEVRRLLFDVFEAEMPLPAPADFNHILAAHGRRYINTLKPTY